jgi:DNA-binding protein HU-beta
MTKSVATAVKKEVGAMVDATPTATDAAPAAETTPVTTEAAPVETETTAALEAPAPVAETVTATAQATQKQLLIKFIAQRGGVSLIQARVWFDTVFAVIEEAIVMLGKVTITGFGTFKAREIAARVGRNPMTGAAINIPKSVRLSFKAGKTTKATLLAAAGGSLAKKERAVSAQDDVKKARAAVKKAITRKARKA